MGAAGIRQSRLSGQKIWSDDGLVIMHRFPIGNKVRFGFQGIVIPQGGFHNLLYGHGVIEPEITVFIPDHQLFAGDPVKPGQGIGNDGNITVKILSVSHQLAGFGVFAIESGHLLNCSGVANHRNIPSVLVRSFRLAE